MPKRLCGGQRAVLTGIIWIIGIYCATPPAAQDTDTLRLQIGDVSGFVNSIVEIPIGIEIPSTDTVDGFLISAALSRDDLAYFEVDTVEQDTDTLFVCQFDTMGALASGWEYVQARSIGGVGLDVRVSGIADVGSGTTPGIPSSTSGTLIKVFLHVRSNVPDTLTDRVLYINVHRTTTNFSNQDGELIAPVKITDGSLTVEEGISGDVNCDGHINPADVVYMVNYVYKNWQILCNVGLGDLNCDALVNPVDVVLLVNYVYKNWAIPPC